MADVSKGFTRDHTSRPKGQGTPRCACTKTSMTYFREALARVHARARVRVYERLNIERDSRRRAAPRGAKRKGAAQKYRDRSVVLFASSRGTRARNLEASSPHFLRSPSPRFPRTCALSACDSTSRLPFGPRPLKIVPRLACFSVARNCRVFLFKFQLRTHIYIYTFRSILFDAAFARNRSSIVS